ncbi:MAG: Hsp20/alpha crystallin family protein [Chloroflexi bacterium]|jgi:HSP20 family protein|nr:Hsp20/alpha crystallin family protein [Chloroflexota bacterium]
MSNEVVRWEPFNEMVSLRDAVNRLFEDSFIRPGAWPLPFEAGALSIPTDMIETKDNVIVKVSAPGVESEDIEISVVGDTLTIKGETKSEEHFEEASYIRKERRFGSFQRTLSLPASVASDKAKAEFENGVLTLTLPKAEEAKPKSIKITTKK